MHRMPGGADASLQQLTARIATLQKGIDQLLKCVQVSKSQGVSLKGGMKVSIQAGGKLSLKSGGAMQLKAGFIHLNPPAGQTPTAAKAAAKTALSQITKDATVLKALKTVSPSLLT